MLCKQGLDMQSTRQRRGPIIAGEFLFRCGRMARSGRRRCYFLPPDKAGDTQRLMTAAICAVPNGARLMVLADVNADLDFPRGRQEVVLAAETSKHDLVCATKQFCCRRKRRHVRGRWTFRRPTYTPDGGAALGALQT